MPQARGAHLLFLDSDMLPDTPDFLERWTAVADSGAAVAFGGFTLDQTPPRPEHALHRAMALKSDCTPAPPYSRITPTLPLVDSVSSILRMTSLAATHSASLPLSRTR